MSATSGKTSGETSGELSRSLDNSLTRLSTLEFIEKMREHCNKIGDLLFYYLDQSLHTMICNALKQFQAKHPFDPATLREFGAFLNEFISNAIKLRRLCVRMSFIVTEIGNAEFLLQLSDNPFCTVALGEMGSHTGVIGGRTTAVKRLFGKDTWKGAKLGTFFDTLELHLQAQFSVLFCIPSKSKMKMQERVSQMLKDAAADPNFGQSELSADVQRVVEEIMGLVKIEFMLACPIVPSHRASIPPNA